MTAAAPAPGPAAPAPQPSAQAGPGPRPAAHDLPRRRRLWVGTYPDEESAPGSGEGVWSVELELAPARFVAARQVVALPAPSFLAVSADERTVYAVAETDDGAVTALRAGASGEVLEPLSTVPSGGSFPCHVSVSGDQVWVANYGSGGFTTVTTAPDGSFASGPATHAGSGSGPVADRQEGPHAHFAVRAPDGAAWVVDLGADRVRRYVRTAEGVGEAGAAVALPPGTGPRHVAVADPGSPGEGYAFLVGELDAQVHVLALGAGADGLVGATAVGQVAACTTPAPAGVGAFPSHVALSPDGHRLYVAVRGPDVVATFAVRRAGDGAVTLRHLADSPLVGTWPRHFAVLDTEGGDVLVVAGQTSSTLEALRVRPRSGRAEHLSSLALPSPACVVERRILVG